MRNPLDQHIDCTAGDLDLFRQPDQGNGFSIYRHRHLGHILDLFARLTVLANNSSPEPVKLSWTVGYGREVDYIEDQVLILKEAEGTLGRKPTINRIYGLDSPEEPKCLITLDDNKPFLAVDGNMCPGLFFQFFLCCALFSDKGSNPVPATFISCLIMLTTVPVPEILFLYRGMPSRSHG